MATIIKIDENHFIVQNLTLTIANKNGVIFRMSKDRKIYGKNSGRGFPVYLSESSKRNPKLQVKGNFSGAVRFNGKATFSISSF